MKLNKTYTICLTVACLLLLGVAVVKAAGFVSFETDKIQLWDNTRVVGAGMKMSQEGVGDMEVVAGGVLKIVDKDLYLRGFVGLNCPNYPQKNDCETAIGNIGNTFLNIDAVSAVKDITLLAQDKDLYLNSLEGNIAINGKLIIKDNHNLIVIPEGTVARNTIFSSTWAREIRTNWIEDVDPQVGITFPPITFSQDTSSTTVPIFSSKRLINLSL